MKGDGALRRRALLGAPAVLAAAALWLFVFSAEAPHAGKSRGAFRGAIRVGAVDLYCNRDDDRVHMDARVYYGQPREALQRRYRTAGVVASVRILRKTGRRALARARDEERIEFTTDAKRTGLWHRVRFGRSESRRIRRYAHGRGDCGEGSRTRRVRVKLRFVERLRRAAASTRARVRRRAGLTQRRRATQVRRVGQRSCTSDAGSDCAGAPEGNDPGQSQPGGEGTEPGGSAEEPASCLASGQSASSQERQVIGTVESGEIDEASGLVASRQNPGVLWVHNDSGDSARLFAISTQGKLLGIYEITGAAARDWEDMAIGPGPVSGSDYLYIGDIGDNSAVRGSVVVYRVPEPEVFASQTPRTVQLAGAESLVLRYPDGARDAETLVVDPLDGDIYVVSKRDLRPRLYRFSYQPWTAETRTLDFLGELTWWGPVGGDISPSGGKVVVKGYWNVYLYERAAGADLRDVLLGGAQAVPYTPEPQGEALAFCGEQAGYLTLSEGDHPPLYLYP